MVTRATCGNESEGKQGIFTNGVVGSKMIHEGYLYEEL